MCEACEATLRQHRDPDTKVDFARNTPLASYSLQFQPQALAGFPALLINVARGHHDVTEARRERQQSLGRTCGNARNNVIEFGGILVPALPSDFGDSDNGNDSVATPLLNVLAGRWLPVHIIIEVDLVHRRFPGP